MIFTASLERDVSHYYKQVDIRFGFIWYRMRFVPVTAGALLAIISIPAYYYSPSILTNTVHAFIGSLSNGNTINAAGMLHQMGYPPLHQVILIFQYLLIG